MTEILIYTALCVGAFIAGALVVIAIVRKANGK